MRCKDAKATIKRLERENSKLRERARFAERDPNERIYGFNLLEIVVRPRYNPTIVPIIDDSCKIDMRVIGCSELDIPTIHTYRTVMKSAIHLLRENRQDFIRRMGELMAAELLDFADKNLPEANP